MRTSTVKYRQSAPPSHPFVVVLWRCRWSAVCRSYDMNLVHILHVLQSIRTFERTHVHKLYTKPAKCDLSTLRFSHCTHFVALCHTIFLSLAVKSRWGALARRGALAVLYGIHKLQSWNATQAARRRGSHPNDNYSEICLRQLLKGPSKCGLCNQVVSLSSAI